MNNIKKMFNLVKNEYIKNIFNLSSIIFLIFVTIYTFFSAKLIIDQNNGTVMTFWKLLSTSFDNYGFYLIFLMIKATKVITSEYSTGTITQILIRPYHKKDILFYKYLFVITLAISLIVIHLILFASTGMILLSHNGFDFYDNVSINNQIIHTNLLTNTLWSALSTFIDSIVYLTLAFMLAVLLRKSTLSIVLSLIIWIAGASINVFIPNTMIKNLLFTSNLNLDQYLISSTSVNSNGFLVSLIILIVYITGFYMISNIVFCKRDILNSTK